jgi:hypothetical protein
MMQCRQEIELKILIKYEGIVNVKRTNILGVIIDRNLSCKVYVERNYSTIAIIYIKLMDYLKSLIQMWEECYIIV